MPAEYPIRFTDEMVRALLADPRMDWAVKTQTRRLVKGVPVWADACELHEPSYANRHLPAVAQWKGPARDDDGELRRDLPKSAVLAHEQGRCYGTSAPCKYGTVGDLLWVREAWQAGGSDNGPGVSYRADGDRYHPDWQGRREFPYELYPCANWERGYWLADVESGANGRWSPNLYLPRWASRITLTVTGLRVHRLWDISEEDARAEGALLWAQDRKLTNRQQEIRDTLWCRYTRLYDPESPVVTARAAFFALWDSIYGPDEPGKSVRFDPWVFARTFTTSVRRKGADY